MIFFLSGIIASVRSAVLGTDIILYSFERPDLYWAKKVSDYKIMLNPRVKKKSFKKMTSKRYITFALIATTLPQK